MFFPSRSVLENRILRERSPLERFHILLTRAEESSLAMVIAVTVILVILASCVSMVLETLPDFLELAPGCEFCKTLDADAVTNQTLLQERATRCVGCEPKSPAGFDTIETFAVTVFTIEYGLKLFTAFSCPMRFEKFPQWKRDHPLTPAQLRLLRTWSFVKNPFSVIDLIAILPFYLSLLVSVPTKSLSVFRVVRLLRVLRVFRFGSLEEGVTLFMQVIHNSISFFGVFTGFSFVSIIFLAALVFFCEQGTWDPSSGEYERSQSYFLAQKTPSPFSSIIDSIWLTVVTFTTVGYGDIFPTTRVGKTITTFLMYWGLTLFAMPVTIVGYNLGVALSQANAKRERDERVKQLRRMFVLVYTQGHANDLRRGWNSWRQFTQDEIAATLELGPILRRSLRKFFEPEQRHHHHHHEQHEQQNVIEDDHFPDSEEEDRQVVTHEELRRFIHTEIRDCARDILERVERQFKIPQLRKGKTMPLRRSSEENLRLIRNSTHDDDIYL